MNLIKSLYDQYLSDAQKVQLPYQVYQKRISNLLLADFQMSEQTAALEVISKKKCSKYQKITLSQSLSKAYSEKNVEFPVTVLNISDLEEVNTKNSETMKLRRILIGDERSRLKITLWNDMAEEFTEDKLDTIIVVQGLMTQKTYKGFTYYSLTLHDHYSAPSTVTMRVNEVSLSEAYEKTGVAIIPKLRFRVVSKQLKPSEAETSSVNNLLIQDLSATAELKVWFNSSNKFYCEEGLEYEMYGVKNSISRDSVNKLSISFNGLNIRSIPKELSKIKISITNVLCQSLKSCPNSLCSLKCTLKAVKQFKPDNNESSSFKVFTFLDLLGNEGSFILNYKNNSYDTLNEGDLLLLKNVIVSEYYQRFKATFCMFSLVDKICQNK